jgi:hypothetical protein
MPEHPALLNIRTAHRLLDDYADRILSTDQLLRDDELEFLNRACELLTHATVLLETDPRLK